MEETAKIREWALSRHLDVLPQGRLSKEVMDAYRDWLDSATSADLEQLDKQNEGQQESTQHSIESLSLEEIAQKIKVFERQNPTIQIYFEVRLNSDSG